MRISSAIFLSLVMAFTGTQLEAKTKYRVFAPSGAGESVFLKSGSKNYKYFVVQTGKTLGFDVTGPTKIKIRTRAFLKPGTKNARYQIQIWEGDDLVKGRRVKTRPSKLTLEGSDGSIGLARTLFLKVPKGKHSYRVWLPSDDIDKCFVRFYREKKAKKTPEYTYYRPHEYRKKVHLTSDRNPITYYVVDEDGGATVSVIGPTKLKIYCRANYDHSMKGKSKFTLGVFEKGRIVAQFSASAKKSKKMIFRELDDTIPSTLHKFIMDVPDGEHLYEFRKINTAAPSLAIRFKILTESLGKKK